MAQADAATYGGDPANSTLDAVRLAIGDTDCNDPCLKDAEITYRLTQFGGNTIRAAACSARDAAAKFARKVNTSTGSVRKDLSTIYDHFISLADELEAKANSGMSLVEWYVGGLSISEQQADAADSDLVQPQFDFGQFDNPEAINRLRGKHSTGV